MLWKPERKMGAMLATKPHNAGPGRGNKTSSPGELVLIETPTLAELGVSKRESSEARQIGRRPGGHPSPDEISPVVV
jgi:hypothetical protein